MEERGVIRFQQKGFFTALDSLAAGAGGSQAAVTSHSGSQAAVTSGHRREQCQSLNRSGARDWTRHTGFACHNTMVRFSSPL